VQITNKEEKENERDKIFMDVLEDYQRDKYLRRRLHRKRINARIKALAEIKMFKSNYKHLADKIGAITAVSKNRDRIKHTMQGGCIDIDNKQNKKIFEGILDE
jgi:DNA integrity scanning protein DisA with diadenylate cyclase activity